MFNFFNKIIYLFLTFQEMVLNKKVGKNYKSSFVNTTSKKVFAKAASLELTSKTEQNKQKLKNDVQVILKKYANNPDKLLAFIERSGTKVYKIPFADRILKAIGYEEGFVGKTKGPKALYLSIMLAVFSKQKIKISLSTDAIFVLRDLPLDCYYMMQQFHKWYAMKLNLPGFDAESQDNFQKFLSSSNDSKIKELSIEEILGLKEAISRDVEAISFVVDLAKSTAGAKNALKKVVSGGASV